MMRRELTGHLDGDHVVLLVATKVGLYRFTADTDRRRWHRFGPCFTAHDVSHAAFDPRDGAIWAAANNGDARVYRSENLGHTWDAKGAPFAADLVWHVEPGPIEEPKTVLAGIMPAALFRSRDGGDSWQPIAGLNEHETRDEWWAGGGGLCLHSILMPPARLGRIYAGISVAGLFRSDDDGDSWQPANVGVTNFADLMESEQPVKHRGVHRCVHKVVAHPHQPDTLFQQNHLGVFRSRDGGTSWQSINAGLPTNFGFPIAIGAGTRPSVFVIPESEETIRTPGHLAVWRSDDEGETWSEQRSGLPVIETSVLREAMATDNRDQTGVYFGTRDGALFASIDNGEHWQQLANDLPGIRSVKVAYAG